MEFRSIRQTAKIDGLNRNPGEGEHEKALVWDNNLKNFKYVSYSSSIGPNTKSTNGYISKGDDAASGGLVWKLDAGKNPAWRSEQFLESVSRLDNSLVFTMNEGQQYSIQLGSLAWADELTSTVTSVFGRPGDVVAMAGDYTAEQVTNAFDKTKDTLGNIAEGLQNKHFTLAYRDAVNLNTEARHSHGNKAHLDLITNAGGGIIPSAVQIGNWDYLALNFGALSREAVANFIADNTGISWVYDAIGETFTPTINLAAFTTDALPEGAVNKYYRDANNRNLFTIVLPYASTVADRCANPIYLPTGWSLSATGSGVDIQIAHNLNRPLAGVTVFSINGSTGDERLLISNAAYSGVVSSNTKNSLIIESLATVPTSIRINISLV